MPDPHRLIILADLRRAAGVTLEQMAQACGLTGKRSRESVADWERGKSIPHARHRSRFLDYLADRLGLRQRPEQLRAVWEVLDEVWGWDPLTDADWRHLFGPASAGAAAVRQGAIADAPVDQRARPLDLTLLPPPAPLPPGSRMPFSRNPHFVGRVDQLHALAAALLYDASPSRPHLVAVAATGGGGMGKTQLAIEFVHRYGQYFPGGVFWLSFADGPAIPAEVAMCGDAGHLALRPDFAHLTLDRRVRLVTEAWELAVPRLLVFDNCENPALLAQWRPRAGGCQVIVTSRRTAWDAQLGVQTLLIGTLSRSESVELLRSHCPDLQPADSALTAIATELDDLPLALHLAGRYLARYRPTVTTASYVSELRSPRLLEHASLQAEGRAPGGYEEHVGRTFALSYNQLEAKSPLDRLALALLHRAACFAPGEPIPRELLFASLDQHMGVHSATPPLLRLLELGLLEPTVADASGAIVALRMHRLIVAFVRQRAADGTAQAAVEQAVAEAVAILQSNEQLVDLLQLDRHLRVVADAAAARRDARAAVLLFQLSLHLLEIEDFAGAIDANQRSLDIRRELFGASDLAISPNLHHMGWIYDCQGRSLAAVELHQQALVIRRATLGDRHLDTAESFNYVGTALHAMCAYPDAHEHYTQALAIRTELGGADHWLTAQSLNNLGLLLHARGQYADALTLHQRALAIRERFLAPTHPRLSITLNNLGYLLRALGRFAEARTYLSRALTIREQIYGPDNTYVAVTLNHLGRLHHALGDYAIARVHLERALTIREQSLMANHPDTANSLGNLGMLWLDLGDLASADPYLRRALAIHEQVWGMNHRHTARSLNHLGLLHHAQGNRAGAVQCFEQALAIRARVLGPAHPDTANSQGNLAMVLAEAGDGARVRQLILSALASHQQVLGQEHPYTARSLLRAGLLQQSLDAIGGRSLIERALAIYERALGPEHPHTVACRATLHQRVGDLPARQRMRNEDQ